MQIRWSVKCQEFKISSTYSWQNIFIAISKYRLWNIFTYIIISLNFTPLYNRKEGSYSKYVAIVMTNMFLAEIRMPILWIE